MYALHAWIHIYVCMCAYGFLHLGLSVFTFKRDSNGVSLGVTPYQWLSQNQGTLVNSLIVTRAVRLGFPASQQLWEGSLGQAAAKLHVATADARFVQRLFYAACDKPAVISVILHVFQMMWRTPLVVYYSMFCKVSSQVVQDFFTVTAGWELHAWELPNFTGWKALPSKTLPMLLRSLKSSPGVRSREPFPVGADRLRSKLAWPPPPWA